MVLQSRVTPKVSQASDLHRLSLQIKGIDVSRGQWAIRIANLEVITEDSDTATSILTDIIRQ